jgi:hypothetical protein
VDALNTYISHRSPENLDIIFKVSLQLFTDHSNDKQILDFSAAAKESMIMATCIRDYIHVMDLAKDHSLAA